jgi:hypothetical protein
MVAIPFYGPKLKIANGRRHVRNLDSEIAAYLSDNPWAQFLVVNRKTGQHVIAFTGRAPIPDTFALIFGDAVHNFRTALDILANDIIALNGVQPKKVYFPFGDSAVRFEEQLKTKIGQAPSDIQDIFRSFEPYKGGNETLRAMHDLDIRDKHLAIMQAAPSSATPPLPTGRPEYEYIGGDFPHRLKFTADFSMLKTTPIDLTGFPFKPNDDIEVLGKIAGSTVDLIIGPDLPLASQPVIRSLNDMGDLAERIVQTFESYCLRGH